MGRGWRYWTVAWVHEKPTSREGSSGMGPSGHFGPLRCDDPNGRRGTLDWAPPPLLVMGAYWVWAVQAAGGYFRHTQADPLLAASAAWATRQRLSLLPAPSLEINKKWDTVTRETSASNFKGKTVHYPSPGLALMGQV